MTVYYTMQRVIKNRICAWCGAEIRKGEKTLCRRDNRLRTSDYACNRCKTKNGFEPVPIPEVKKPIQYHYDDIFRYWLSNHRPGDIGERWFVQNTTTWKSVPCSSEAACKKIVANALADLNGKEMPHKRATLEYKATWLLEA